MTMRLLKDPATVSSRIFVGHLQTDDTTKTELEEYFGKHGTILGSAINRGFAFIQFDSEEAAQNAIKNENGAMFKNRRIDVKPAKKDPNPPNHNQNQDNPNNNSFGNRNQSFSDSNNMKQNFNSDNQFNRNEQFGNRFGNDNMNQNQSFNSSGPGGGPMGRGKGRGNMKNIKGSQENMPPRPGFRDRSPLGRAGGDKWSDMNMSGGFRGSFNEPGGRFDSSGPSMRDSYSGSGGPDYPSSAEKNDCEIIVVSKMLTEYAEMIEMRLKKLGLTVDLLFPNEDVPLSRVLGNIASRGCLYAVVVTLINQEHRSMTLNILHGLPQEHRNMPVDDAINFISRDFNNYKSGGRSVPLSAISSKHNHPDAIQVLLNMLADNRQLTVLQYDRVLKYLEIKREEQVQNELGDVKDLGSNAALVNNPKQAELQSRILNILNSNKPASASDPSPVPAPIVPLAATTSTVWSTAASSTVTSTTTTSASSVAPSSLLNPVVQKALDSLFQGNLLKKIGDSAPTPTTSTTTPLFAAFSNINNRS